MRPLLFLTLLVFAGCSSDPEPVPETAGMRMPVGFGLSPVRDRRVPFDSPAAVALHPGETPELRRLINRWADHYEVPRSLVHRVVQRESDYRAGARNGPYFGLMQILPETAATMGYRGPDAGLLEASTNLQYGVKYLRGAWLVANGDEAL